MLGSPELECIALDVIVLELICKVVTLIHVVKLTTVCNFCIISDHSVFITKGVNFINILLKAIARADPKSAKIY